jgi:hypothetical protein
MKFLFSTIFFFLAVNYSYAQVHSGQRFSYVELDSLIYLSYEYDEFNLCIEYTAAAR